MPKRKPGPPLYLSENHPIGPRTFEIGRYVQRMLTDGRLAFVNGEHVVDWCE